MEISFTPNDRGQVGIGTLIVFIAMVLVAAIAAGVLINTAGFLQTQAEDTGTESTEQVANNLNIITEVGTVAEDGDEDTINEILLGVQPAAGSDDLNLEELSIQYVSDESFSNLVHVKDASASDEGDLVGEGTVFNTQAVTAEDGEDNVMTDNADRYEIVTPLDDDKPFVETDELDIDDSGDDELFKIDVAYNDSDTDLADIAGIFDEFDEDDFVEVNATQDDVDGASLFPDNAADGDSTTDENELVDDIEDSDLDDQADENIVRVVVYNDEVDPLALSGFDEELGEIEGEGELADQGALQPSFFDDLDNGELEELVEGEEAELTFTTETGAQTVAILQVPDSLAGEDGGDTVDL